MTISELIKTLHEIKDDEGDIEVQVYCDDTCQQYLPTSISIDKEEGCVVIS